MRILMLAGLAVSMSAIQVSAQTPPPVPSAFQDLYTQLSGHIGTFNTTISAGWNGSKYPVLNSAQLRSAASAAGPALLGSQYYTGVLNELQSLQALGVTAVTVHIDFPLLDPAYSTSYQNYLNFYVRLASDIRARGLKLLVEDQIVFSTGGAGINCSAFYNSLSWSQYEAGRAQQAALIAQQIKPDYLSVITEPDTEATYSLKSEPGTASGSLDMLNQILAAIQTTGVQGVRVGAGVGTWLNSFQTFIQNYTGTAVQYIDMHVYQINGAALQNALTIASMAHAAGKQVSMSENWMYKMRDSEQGLYTADQIHARDPFSFWAPLDASFLQMIANFANYQQLAFVAPYNTTYFHAYLDYNTYANYSTYQILSAASAQSSAAINTGMFTTTALAYENMFLSLPDKIPPSVPTGLSFVATPSQINLAWAAASDNVGVGGYRVYRNGILLGTTCSLYYNDLGLPSGYSALYTVLAYDVAGNASPLSAALTAKTVDNIPPSTPGTPSLTPGVPGQIKLSWTPSTDNVAVIGYKVYRGTSPTALSQISTAATNSYTDSKCVPGTTYSYALVAYDAGGNVSPQSQVASAKAPSDTTPPSVPTGLAGTAVSSTTIALTWLASSDDVAVAGYSLYRGSTASSLSQIGFVKTLVFTDATVSTSRTYYYSVAAADTAGNLSAKSPTISVLTL